MGVGGGSLAGNVIGGVGGGVITIGGVVGMSVGSVSCRWQAANKNNRSR